MTSILDTLRMWGGLLNEVAFLWFIDKTVFSIRKGLALATQDK